MSPHILGYLSSILLLITLGSQIHKQWKRGSSRGISPWLFVGQFAASCGFIAYSALIDSSELELAASSSDETSQLVPVRSRTRPQFMALKRPTEPAFIIARRSDGLIKTLEARWWCQWDGAKQFEQGWTMRSKRPSGKRPRSRMSPSTVVERK